MSARVAIFEALASVFDFGHVAATSLASVTRQVLATLEGHADDDEGTNAESRVSTLWGHAAILMRPKAPTTSPDGRCEVFFVRHGDELVPVASRDLRWQVDLAEGDVVIRNLDGTNPVRLHLLADGTAVLEANTVKIGDAGATEAIGLGTAIKGHLDALKTYIDAVATAFGAHKHTGVTPGVGTSAVGDTPIVGTNPSVPDVESRHKVEN